MLIFRTPPTRSRSLGITPKSMGRDVPFEQKGAIQFLRLAALFPGRSSRVAFFSVFQTFLISQNRPGVGIPPRHLAPPTRMAIEEMLAPMGGLLLRQETLQTKYEKVGKRDEQKSKRTHSSIHASPLFLRLIARVVGIDGLAL